MTEEKRNQVLNSEEFKKIIRQRNSISLFLTITMLLLYFGFILLIAFQKEALSAKAGGKVTYWIIIGLALIVFAWIITGVYVSWANNKYDVKINEIKNKLLS